MSKPHPDVNLFDLTIQKCPYEAYRELRDTAPAYQCPYSGMYIVTRFDDVKRVLSDDVSFSNQAAYFNSDRVATPREQRITDTFEAEGWLPAPTLAGRDDPDESLLSTLVNTVIEEWGRPMNDNELHAEIMADTFVGGSETTTNAISAGVKLLIENKAVWEQLKSDPDRYLKNFIEEVLRLESPVQSLMRIATCDIEMGGEMIPAGSVINVRYAAANRDERRYEEADVIDLERKNAGGHMAFGAGKHHCLGAPLVRRELFWAFTAVLDRIDDMWFAEGKNEFEYHPHFLLRSMKALHIEFKPR